MAQKTITDEIIKLLNDPVLPAKKNGEPIEHGLFIGLQPNRSKLFTCAFYGSIKDVGASLSQGLEEAPELRLVVFSAVFAYCKSHPDDSVVLTLRAKLDAQAPEYALQEERLLMREISDVAATEKESREHRKELERQLEQLRAERLNPQPKLF